MLNAWAMRDVHQGPDKIKRIPGTIHGSFLSAFPGDGLCKDPVLAIDPSHLLSSHSWCFQGLGHDPPRPVIGRTTFVPKSHPVSTRNSMMDGSHAHLWTWCPSYEINFLRLARIWSPSESPLKNFPFWNNLRLFFLKSDEGRKGALEWYYKEIGRRCLMTTSEVLCRNCCSDSFEVRVTTIYIAQPLTKWAIKIKYLWIWFWGQPSHQGKAQAVLSTLEITRRFSSQGMAMCHLFVPGPQPLPFS